MGHFSEIWQALAERERAARELSRPPIERETPPVEAPPERQPQDVLMCHWLSAWLVEHWLKRAARDEHP